MVLLCIATRQGFVNGKRNGEQSAIYLAECIGYRYRFTASNFLQLKDLEGGGFCYICTNSRAERICIHESGRGTELLKPREVLQLNSFALSFSVILIFDDNVVGAERDLQEG